jgi:hypothetical protein
MADNFYVNHNNYSVVNDALAAEVNNMDKIMQDLNNILATTPDASGGKATPLWRDQQINWTRAYQDMKEQLNALTRKSFLVATNFHDGDNQGARAMM